MTESTFWCLIDDANSQSDGDESLRESLIKLLVALPKADLFDFDDFYRRFLDGANTYPLSDALRLINGGCGDDGWFDFRDYLISRGRTIYRRTIEDPESLLLDKLDSFFGWTYGEYHYHLTASEAYRIQLGRPDDYIEIPHRFELQRTSGKIIDTKNDTEVKKHFPRIWEWKQTAKDAG